MTDTHMDRQRFFILLKPLFIWGGGYEGMAFKLSWKRFRLSQYFHYDTVTGESKNRRIKTYAIIISERFQEEHFFSVDRKG